jgi:DNA-binding transcriptional ArsR family regulator
MKRVQYIKPVKEPPEEEMFDLIDLMLDPIRSKIMFEVVLRGETTAEILVEVTKKSRSTISHHLKKLVQYGILDVFMNPAGKTKYYRMTQNLSNLIFTFDTEEFLKGTIEDRSSHVIDLYQMYAMINHIYANIFSDQIKLVQKHLPFEDVTVENKEIEFKIKDREIKMPYFSSLVIGEKQAAYLSEKFREVMRDYKKEFGDLVETLKISDFKSKYLMKLIVFPYIDEQDFDNQK